MPIIVLLIIFIRSLFKSECQLALENLALRQQLVEAFPFDSASHYLLHDRDAIYGEAVQRRIKSLGFEEVVTAPRSPWQNPYVERIIGSIRRECLEHVIVLNEGHLRRILRDLR